MDHKKYRSPQISLMTANLVKLYTCSIVNGIVGYYMQGGVSHNSTKHTFGAHVLGTLHVLLLPYLVISILVLISLKVCLP